MLTNETLFRLVDVMSRLVDQLDDCDSHAVHMHRLREALEADDEAAAKGIASDLVKQIEDHGVALFPSFARHLEGHGGAPDETAQTIRLPAPPLSDQIGSYPRRHGQRLAAGGEVKDDGRRYVIGEACSDQVISRGRGSAGKYEAVGPAGGQDWTKCLLLVPPTEPWCGPSSFPTEGGILTIGILDRAQPCRQEGQAAVRPGIASGDLDKDMAANPSNVTDPDGNALTAQLFVPNGVSLSAIEATLFLTCPNHLVEFWEHARSAMKAGQTVKLHLPTGSTIGGCTVVDVVALSGQDAYRVEIRTAAK